MNYETVPRDLNQISTWVPVTEHELHSLNLHVFMKNTNHIEAELEKSPFFFLTCLSLAFDRFS